MKTLKRVLVICLVALSALFVSCPDPNGNSVKPHVTKIIGYSWNTEKQQFEEFPFENGSTSMSYKLAKIEIKFDRPMDTESGCWAYWGHANQYYTDYRWVNSYTYVFVFNPLFYGANFKLVLNYDPNSEYTPFRDLEGNNLSAYPIEFTVENDAIHPMVKEIDIGNYLTEDMFFDLQFNQYSDPPNLQTSLGIVNVLAPYCLKAGDTLKIKYKVRANDDLPEVKVSLVDTSDAVKNWRIFTEEKNFSLADEPITASTEENPVYFEKEISFVLINDMSPVQPQNAITIQFTCFADACDPLNDTVQFYIGANK